MVLDRLRETTDIDDKFVYGFPSISKSSYISVIDIRLRKEIGKFRHFTTKKSPFDTVVVDSRSSIGAMTYVPANSVKFEVSKLP
jgi:hypothetical protein